MSAASTRPFPTRRAKPRGSGVLKFTSAGQRGVHGEIQKERPHSGAENIEADCADMAKIEAAVRAA